MIQRTAWLKRGKPPKRRRSTPRRSSRVLDPQWLAEVRRLPCCLRGQDCGGRIESDHAGKRGLGQKCSDLETIPLCTRHHCQRTDYSGVFRGWDAERMRAWCAERIAETVVTVTAQLAGIGGAPEVDRADSGAKAPVETALSSAQGRPGQESRARVVGSEDALALASTQGGRGTGHELRPGVEACEPPVRQTSGSDSEP